jgi:tRNA G18 (ribose-2'-O)-methylase SpoU
MQASSVRSLYFVVNKSRPIRSLNYRRSKLAKMKQPNIISIQDLNDPRLDPYRQLKTNIPSRQEPGFIAEGKFVVERLLASDLAIFSVLLSEKRLSGFVDKLRPEVPAYLVPHKLASDLVGFDFHAGVLAYGRKPIVHLVTEFQHKLEGAESSETDGKVKSGAGRLLIACPETNLPDNLGSIIRLSAAFGADGLVVSQRAADPYGRRCVRVSMGNVFKIPTLSSHQFLADLLALKQSGYQLIACHQSPRSQDVRTFGWCEKNLLIFGNEAHGIPAEMLEICDHQLEIPISARVDSLNVSTAAGIILYEWSRRFG